MKVNFLIINYRTYNENVDFLATDIYLGLQKYIS